MRWLLIGLALLSTATQAQDGSPFDCSGPDDSALVVGALGASAARLDQERDSWPPEAARILRAATIPGAVTYVTDPSVCEQASAEWEDSRVTGYYPGDYRRLSAYHIALPDGPPAVVLLGRPVAGPAVADDGRLHIRHAHTEMGLKVRLADGSIFYCTWG